MHRLESGEGHHARTEAHRVYVYGIIRLAEGEDERRVTSLNGLVGNPIRSIAGDGLAALVSTLATPGATSFEEELKDPERATSLVLDHHRVLQHLSDSRTVLPMRFGALFPDDEKLCDALHEHRQGLLQALERVEGAREWGVKIFCDRSILCSHLEEKSPAMLAAQDELAAAAQGRAFFLQRRIARLAEEEAQRVIAQGVEESRRRLCDTARADAPMKLQAAAVHGRADDMVWNGALLVAKPAEDRFFALIDELRQAHAPCGLDYETNGPWPPFSFADYRLGE
jgi:hypothetical protein